MHAVEDLENTLKDIFITTESTYNQQVELENLLEEVDPRSLIVPSGKTPRPYTLFALKKTESSAWCIANQSFSRSG